MAKTILEPSRKLKVVGEFDVVVCGGGPAGVAAAVSAGRNGARVILIEQTGCLGGMGTSGLVPTFCPFSWENAPDRNPAVRGIGLEVLDHLRAIDGTDMGVWPTIDAEKLKLVYDEMAAQAMVNVQFFTQVSDVIVQAGKIRSIIIESKAGRQALAGKVFVDATGDADLAARAGAAFEKGDNRGKMQGCTLCFTVSGADTKAYFQFVRSRFKSNSEMTAWLQQCQQQGTLPSVAGAEYRVICHKELHPGTLSYNFGHVFGIDATDPRDLSRGMILGRRLAHNFVDFARGQIPGMANAHIVATGALLGVRETRRITGMARLSFEDFEKSRHFADDIAVYDYPIDVHPTSSNRKETARTDRQMETLVQPAGATYGIRYGIMLTAKPTNLLVPGRAISADRMMQGSLRVMPPCLAMGQAAGTAAALSLRKKTPLARLDIEELRKVLEKQGARLQ